MARMQCLSSFLSLALSLAVMRDDRCDVHADDNFVCLDFASAYRASGTIIVWSEVGSLPLESELFASAETLKYSGDFRFGCN